MDKPRAKVPQMYTVAEISKAENKVNVMKTRMGCMDGVNYFLVKNGGHMV